MSKHSESLDDALAAYKRDKRPDRDLWQGIELAIVDMDEAMLMPKHNTSARKYVGLAASICVLVLVGAMSFYSGKELQGDALISAMSDAHQKQKHALLISYKDTKAATDNWEQQMQDLDEAEAAIKQALEASPNNPALLNMLKQVYEQQLNLIERVHAPQWNKI